MSSTATNIAVATSVPTPKASGLAT